jgi:hypothetical protein
MDKLAPYIQDLEEIEAIKGKMPCGDDRAETGKIANRIRELLCTADAELEKGRNIDKILSKTQSLINLILK